MFMAFQKSTQTNKYETACFVQEAPVSSELPVNGYVVKRSAENLPYCEFESTLMTFNEYNRMRRRYDAHNIDTVIATDERINDLLRRHQWRGEWNHPNPDIKGQQYSDIRMTIPAPQNTSHFMNFHEFANNKMTVEITTHPKTESGKAYSSEIIDLKATPSYSVRILGVAIPNAGIGQPNIRVSKFITADAVDFPSHQEAEADIQRYTEAATQVLFLKELSKYCVDQDENMKVVCESFEISPEEIMGIQNESIIVEQCDGSMMAFPLRGDVRREALSILKNL
jgi:hypothetical protein